LTRLAFDGTVGVIDIDYQYQLCYIQCDVQKEISMFLSDAPVGASFRVIQVILAREVGKRLADMGFTEGAEGVVVRAGFMHGPLQVQIRGYDILIRCCEAAGIEIQPVGLWPVAGAADWIRGRPGRRGFGGGKGTGRGRGRGRGPVAGLGRGA
jgi:ferrous iron transport protein A